MNEREGANLPSTMDERCKCVRPGMTLLGQEETGNQWMNGKGANNPNKPFVFGR
jgi:hypothetical protein